MQNWVAYIKEYVNSDLWGFILLDYYHHTKSEGCKGSPSQFIDEMLRELPKEDIDAVAFHNSLLGVCVHLLGIDFSDTMDKSIAFLKSLTNPPGDDQVRSIISQYEIYGKQEVFRERLATSDLGIMEMRAKHKKVKGKEDPILTGIRQAIEVAKKCEPEDERTHPKVGTVIVKNNQIVCSAYRGEMKPGEHAEYAALKRKSEGIDLAGATLITTLEPCTARKHKKKPCALHVVESGVNKVIIGMIDPNPGIRGKGVIFLQQHKVAVELFPSEYQEEVLALNSEFWSEEGKKYGIDVMHEVSLEKNRAVAIASTVEIRQEVGSSKEGTDIAEMRELPLLSYLTKIRSGRPLENYVVIFLQHLLGDFARSIPSFERAGISPENALILGIPYSTKPSVVSYLREKRYPVLSPYNYPFIEDVNKIIKDSIGKAKRKGQKILIVEDGGYIVPLLHERYLDDIDWFKGAVEQTANGIWRDRELELKRSLKIPVMNVAECPLKQLIESPLVGEAVVRNMTNLFAKMGKGIGGKEVLIVGYGNIGKQVADSLKSNKAITYVYDFDKTKLLQAKNDGHIIREALAEAVKNKFAIIGGTGREVIDKDIILLLDHNTYLVNATSKRAEINFNELDALTITDGVSEISGGVAQVHKLINENNVILVAKGFPVNFYGEAESIPDEDIQFVAGLLLKGVFELADNEFEPGIHDIPEEARQEIARLQLKLRA